MTRRRMTATHWGIYQATSTHDRRLEVLPWDGDEAPSLIGEGAVSAVHHPCRVKWPAVRESYLTGGPGANRERRGAERFVEVSWEKALDLAAAELARVRQTHGNAAIFGGSYGWASAGRFHHAQSQLHRFLNCLGGYTPSIDTYSYAAVSALMPHIVGPFSRLILDEATSWDAMEGHSDLVVMFGGLPLKNAQVNAGGVGRHTMRGWLKRMRAGGTRFVSISPIRTDAPDETEAEWLAPWPGTDTALMLGLAHVLHTEGLADSDFIGRYTVGFQHFLPYLTGQTDGVPKDADWASGICRVDAGSIRDLARRMARGRTMILVAWSLQRAEHGEQPCWMAVVLAAMLGQIGLPGGGFGIGHGCENGVGNPTDPIRFPAFPQGSNPVADGIPVARISDALLAPGEAYRFNGADRNYPDLRLVYWAGGNPFHHQMDLGKLVRAFQRPETIIVSEIWWTATARHADIVFPVTSAFERRDIALVRWDPAMVAMEPMLRPRDGARDDYEIFAELAERLGVRDAFTEGKTSEEWIGEIWTATRETGAARGTAFPDLQAFREAGVVERPVRGAGQVLLADFRADPERCRLNTPSGKVEIFSERIAGFGYADCPGHPTWIPPTEFLGSATARTFPMHLISNQPRTRLHSQLDCGDVSRGSKVGDREPATLNPHDAAARGIADGDVIRIFNRRGHCLAGAVLSNAVMPGVVQLSTGAWYDPETPGDPAALCKHGNPNVLTRDAGSSELGQGPIAQSALVQVEKFRGVPPPVTAFRPPVIVALEED